MKQLLNILFPIFIIGMIFTACNKENIDEITTEDPSYDPTQINISSLLGAVSSGTEEGMRANCLEISYPFELNLTDGTQIEIISYDSYESALVSSNKAVSFVYPLQGINENGLTTTFDDELSLGRAFAACTPDDGWDLAARSSSEMVPAFLLEHFCYDLVYPVNLEDGQGNSYTANNEAEFIELCISIEDLFFTLPLTVSDEDGAETTFEDLESFLEALLDCQGITPPVTDGNIEVIGFGCLTLNYPFNVINEDGDIISINNEDEYISLLLDGNNLTLQFPFSLTNLDGEVYEINSLEELLAAFESCGIIITIEPITCDDLRADFVIFYNNSGKYPYTINYPITMIVEGVEEVFNDAEEYYDVVGYAFGQAKPAEFVYPISIRQFGRDLTFNSDQDVCDFYDYLDEPCEDKPTHIELFHSFVFTPIDCSYFPVPPYQLSFNAQTYTLNSRDEYLDLLETPGAYDGIEVIYPITVQPNTGAAFQFENDEDICAYASNCD